jgi:hypothetical protein
MNHNMTFMIHIIYLTKKMASENTANLLSLIWGVKREGEAVFKRSSPGVQTG